jgi:hypothetical protein
MSWRRVVSKFDALVRRMNPVDDIEEEIRAHLAMEEQENLESGMPPEEAHYAALRRFGNVTLTQDLWR